MSVNSVGHLPNVVPVRVVVKANGQEQQYDVLPGTRLKIKNNDGNVQVSSKSFKSTPIESLGHAIKARLGL